MRALAGAAGQVVGSDEDTGTQAPCGRQLDMHWPSDEGESRGHRPVAITGDITGTYTHISCHTGSGLAIHVKHWTFRHWQH